MASTSELFKLTFNTNNLLNKNNNHKNIRYKPTVWEQKVYHMALSTYTRGFFRSAPDINELYKARALFRQLTITSPNFDLVWLSLSHLELKLGALRGTSGLHEAAVVLRAATFKSNDIECAIALLKERQEI